MDALTLAQQLVEVVRQSGLASDRAYRAFFLAQHLLDDEAAPVRPTALQQLPHALNADATNPDAVTAFTPSGGTRPAP